MKKKCCSWIQTELPRAELAGRVQLGLCEEVACSALSRSNDNKPLFWDTLFVYSTVMWFRRDKPEVCKIIIHHSFTQEVKPSKTYRFFLLVHLDSRQRIDIILCQCSVMVYIWRLFSKVLLTLFGICHHDFWDFFEDLIWLLCAATCVTVLCCPWKKNIQHVISSTVNKWLLQRQLHIQH